ncbi:MAG: uracil-DNA glycosylase [Desulfobulbaceae bacterium DB1]|nr:MAG: uracil-DNA glycosylase [Desulfobulbaceae bacterium DB1]
MSGQANGGERPNCFACRHFFITYQASHPYGCKAMGFKSKKNPALVVYESSGLECRLFEKK